MWNNLSPLTGLIAAPYTPFHGDGALNLALIERQAASLVTSGVKGAFVCGTTGEGVSMTLAERMQVAARWQEVAGKQLPVIVHVGHTVLADAQALAAHAQKIGAHGVGCLAPYFYKPAQVDELVSFCAAVAAAAPALPFYYYHIPSMTGVSLPVTDFLRAAGSRIPNLAGAKFTFENLADFAACLQLEGGRYDVVFGRDEILLAGLALGARGAIGSTYNFLAPIFVEVIAAFQAGNLALAQEKQAVASALIEVVFRFGGLPAGKAIMKFIGLDCGTMRLPVRPLSSEQEMRMRKELEAAGFDQACSRL